MPFNTYRPDLMGKAHINKDGPLVCGSWTSVTLIYTAGHFGIDDLGGIKVSIRTASDQTPIQFDDPKAPGYTTVTASNGARLRCKYRKNSNIRPWGNTLHIQCLNFLSEGDTITIVMGDQSEGGAGIRMQTFREYNYRWQVHVDAFATYDFTVLPEDRQPEVELIPGVAAMHKAILPTLRRTGDQFALGLKAEDRWGNPTAEDRSTYTLRASMPVEGLPESVSMTDSDEGALRLDRLSVFKPGDLLIEMLNEANMVVARSNTLRVVETIDFRHFWSDMHGQSGETVGTNTARQYFEFGRNKAFIDICGHQANDFQVSDAFWEELNALTAEFDEPGRFVAVPGYEWSGNTSVGGDHNVWFRNEGRPIYRAHRSLVTDQSTDENVCLDANALFDRLENEDALVVAHVGGRYADVGYAHDAKLEPSVEVHSTWGTFDWIFEDAIKAGYRVGIVGSSDGHKGRIGSEFPGSGKFGSMGGLTCHLMEDLDRDSLFSAFRRRRHYATTGCRPYVNLLIEDLTGAFLTEPDSTESEIDRALIGDIVRCTNNRVDLKLDVAAHTGIERVELRDGLDLLRMIQPNQAGRKAGRRIRIQCEGAEYRGRGRLVNWIVSVTPSGPQVDRITEINFWNPDREAKLEDNVIQWENVTTGGTHAVDIWLDDASKGRLDFVSNQAEFSIDLANLSTDDLVYDCGGLRKAVRVTRLPDAPLPSQLNESFSLDLAPNQERVVYVRITFEDGHIAWTSPIYLSRVS